MYYEFLTYLADEGISGLFSSFGEGISVRMDNIDRWYYTSIIKYINWKEGYFDTLNSRYYFTFKESKENEQCENE